jgi:hypothetical protein
MRHDLLRQVAKDGQQHEDREQLILESLKGSSGVPKRETNEKSLFLSVMVRVYNLMYSQFQRITMSWSRGRKEFASIAQKRAL